MNVKRGFYICSFVVLGILLQFLAHAVVEIWYIDLLTRDFLKYGFGFSWNDWFLIHYGATVILLIAGILFGFWQGKYWWKRLYEDPKKINK